MRAEILTDPLMSLPGQRMIEALIATAPIPVRASTRYTGDCDLLVTYGTGHPLRRPWWKKHRSTGRHCIGLDIGYWDRDNGGMRFTIDEDHPQDWLRDEPGDRWKAQGIGLRNDSSPKGHALIVGMGKKSLVVHGLKPHQWEREAIVKARALGLQPVLKLKRQRYASMSGVPCLYGDIRQALSGASLVLCRHSNVAVDACIAGIPVICEDGAALALYRNGTTPTIEERLKFLESLAWWNWSPDEAAQAWKYLLNRISG